MGAGSIPALVVGLRLGEGVSPSDFRSWRWGSLGELAGVCRPGAALPAKAARCRLPHGPSRRPHPWPFLPAGLVCSGPLRSCSRPHGSGPLDWRWLTSSGWPWPCQGRPGVTGRRRVDEMMGLWLFGKSRTVCSLAGPPCPRGGDCGLEREQVLEPVGRGLEAGVRVEALVLVRVGPGCRRRPQRCGRELDAAAPAGGGPDAA